MTHLPTDIARYCEHLLDVTAPIDPDEVRPAVIAGWSTVGRTRWVAATAAFAALTAAVTLTVALTRPETPDPGPATPATVAPAPSTTAPAPTTTTTPTTTTAPTTAERDASAVGALFDGINIASSEGADAYVAFLAEHTVPGVGDAESCRYSYLAEGPPTYRPQLDRMAGQGSFPDMPGYRRYSLPVSVSGGTARLEWVAVNDEGALWSYACIDTPEAEGPHEANSVLYDIGGCWPLVSESDCAYRRDPDLPQIETSLGDDGFSWNGAETVPAGEVQIGFTSPWRFGPTIVLIVGFAEERAWDEVASELAPGWTHYPLWGMSGGPGAPVFGARLENSCACGEFVWIYAVYDLPPGHYLLAGTTDYWGASVGAFEPFGAFEVVASGE